MTFRYSLEQMKKTSTKSPSEIIKKLGFDETIRLACAMLMDDEWDENLQEFATSLLRELKKKYAEKWNSSWRFDALLGFACNIIMDYDGRYEAYKRAIDKVYPPPPELLIALARCYNGPGVPPITELEAITLIKEAMKEKLYPEGAMLLKGLYRSVGNKKEEQYWENISEKIKETDSELPRLDIIPNITDVH